MITDHHHSAKNSFKMINIQCAICGNKQNTRVLYKSSLNLKKINSKTFSARRIPDGTHYRFLKCLTCSLIFSSPILSPQEINKLYAKSYFSYNNEAKYLQQTYWNYFQKVLKNLTTKNLKLKILEVGCGNGFFLEYLKKHGFNQVYGVEPSQDAVRQTVKGLQNRIKNSILKKNLFPNQSFNLVCCFHTLDHVLNPNDFLVQVKSLLKKDGIALFILHDTEGLSTKLFGERSAIFDIEHIYLFNKKNLTILFEKNGFKVISVFNVTNTYPLTYWFKMVPIPLLLKQLLLKVLTITKLGTIPVSLSAGNLGIIAQRV